MTHFCLILLNLGINREQRTFVSKHFFSGASIWNFDRFVLYKSASYDMYSFYNLVSSIYHFIPSERHNRTYMFIDCNLLVTKAYTLKIQKKIKVVHIYKKRQITTDKVYTL